MLVLPVTNRYISFLTVTILSFLTNNQVTWNC